MIVIDASAILDGYFRPECWSRLITLIRSETILVPQHFIVECLSGLRRIDRSHPLSQSELATFKFFIEQLPLVAVPALTLFESTWSKRQNMTAYDASYVSIAESAEVALVTHDEKLASAAVGLVRIIRLDAPAP